MVFFLHFQIHITSSPEPPSSSVPGLHLRVSLELGIPCVPGLPSPGHPREYRPSPKQMQNR